jgi:branched-chain amino acid transport system permease protein
MICTFGINALLATSLNLVNGFSGMFSMGHAAFMAVGAYSAAFFTLRPEQKAGMLSAMPQWIINTQLPFPVALLLAGLMASFVAVLIGFPVLRFKGHYLSVASLGLIVIVRAVLDNSDKYTNGPRGITGLPGLANTWVIFAVLILAVCVMYRLLKTNYGRGLIAMRDDPVAAQSLGVNLTIKKISVFCISAFIAGVGGALWGHVQTIISGQFFYFNMSFKVVQTSIIGGMSSLSGGIVGALFMTFIPEILAPLESGFKLFGHTLPDMYGISNIIMALLLIILIIFRRQGLMGRSEIIVESIFDKKTYTSLFDKNEYIEFWRSIRRDVANIPSKISRLFSGKGKQNK